jgi:hypothetical protein
MDDPINRRPIARRPQGQDVLRRFDIVKLMNRKSFAAIEFHERPTLILIAIAIVVAVVATSVFYSVHGQACGETVPSLGI